MSYTYTQFLGKINAGIKGKKGILVDARETVNETVRTVLSDIDLRSTARKTPLVPNLFNRVFEYATPSDLKGYGIIDLDPQTDRKQVGYKLVTSEQFMRRQDADSIGFEDNDMVRKLLINANINDKSVTISPLDTLNSGGGTWVLYGDGENLSADSDNFVRESGSIKFGISSAGGTTAGIQNTGLNSTDISSYLGGNGALFVWVYITSITNLTNFKLEIGSDTSNYHTKTITTANDGTAFKNGWNLLRFDLTSLTDTGTPVDTAIDYIALYMTKDASKVSETDYRFDSLILRRGEIHNIRYYSKYGWQTSGGTYIENSTADSDVLNVDTDEFDLMVKKGIEIAGAEVDEFDAADRAEKKYKEMKANYELLNPSDRLLMITDYADFI